jgi:hypothetical protein
MAVGVSLRRWRRCSLACSRAADGCSCIHEQELQPELVLLGRREREPEASERRDA